MSSPPPADSGVAGADDKPRLTEEEKKQNHIASGTASPFGPLDHYSRRVTDVTVRQSRSAGRPSGRALTG